jgi:hypothetical protein
VGAGGGPGEVAKTPKSECCGYKKRMSGLGTE